MRSRRDKVSWRPLPCENRTRPNVAIYVDQVLKPTNRGAEPQARRPVKPKDLQSEVSRPL